MSVDRIRKLLDTASRPPWWVDDGHMIAVCGQDEDGSEHHVGTPNAMTAESSDDATLIAELRNHAEALCDLADAVRDYESAPSYTANCDCLDCSRYRSKVMDAHERMRAALARLDGETDT